ncbi:MAG: 50S ribosomal protein L29 [Candidatus Magasanikbacteria bacterium]|nr:50S ribosomal protein L29 [Candidatus Magasanikbacteria bacterium]
MKFSELKDKTKEEMTEKADILSGTLRELRFRVSTSELKNVREIRKLKKEAAQLLTALKGR